VLDRGPTEGDYQQAIDADNRCTSMTDVLGEVTKYFYDGGTFTGPVREINCNLCGATPGSSLITEQIDPDGNAGIHAGVAFLKYDALDRLIIKIRKIGCIGASCADTITPADAVTTNVYDPVGNRLNATEPNCGLGPLPPNCDSVNYTFDADNRLVKQVNNAGDTTLYSYDGVGNVITVTAPNLNVTTNTYDSLNRLITVTDSDGPLATYGYDPVGNRTSSTDGDGNFTDYAYDVLNRLITTTDPLGKTTTDFYDSVGNLLQVTDRDRNSTFYTYDVVNRRITVTDALGNVTKLQYDPVGNLIKITDANGNSTEYIYDPVNRPIQEIYADGGRRFFAYDDVGNLIQRTDQIGQITHYTYSDLYFLLSRTYPSAINDSFTYDLSGRMLTALRGLCLVSFGPRVSPTTAGTASHNPSRMAGPSATATTFPAALALAPTLAAASLLSKQMRVRALSTSTTPGRLRRSSSTVTIPPTMSWAGITATARPRLSAITRITGRLASLTTIRPPSAASPMPTTARATSGTS
jgi:YD repeat-containing protein